MNSAINSLERIILPFAVKLGKQVHVNAIKNGFIRLLPLTIVGALFVLNNNVFLNFGEVFFLVTGRSSGCRNHSNSRRFKDYWQQRV